VEIGRRPPVHEYKTLVTYEKEILRYIIRVFIPIVINTLVVIIE